MSQIGDLGERLGRASDLPSTLAAAYDAFGGVRLAIRGREEPGSGMFAALVMSATSAIDGRDAITHAPSLPLSSLRREDVAQRTGGDELRIRDLARELAALADLLADRLAEAEQTAALAGDHDACAQAAACAREIHGLLAGAVR